MTLEANMPESESNSATVDLSKPFKASLNLNGEVGRQESDDSAIHSDDDPAHEEKSNNLKKLVKSQENGEGEDKDVNNLVLQESFFTIKILAPGVELFEVQVSPQEMVQELHQLLMDREDTCHRTCFSLQLDGKTMDNFSELKTVEGLKEGAEIKVVEELYSVREARLHMRHVRELLHSADFQDAFNGSDGTSLCYVNMVTEGEMCSDGIGNASSSGNITPDSPTSLTDESSKNIANSTATKRKKLIKSADQSLESPESFAPPEYVMPGCKDRFLTPLHPIPPSKESKIGPCLKVLSPSIWNPPPGNRKLHGDLLYLYAVTAEQKRLHITASSRGFYINQSDMDSFNPKPAQGTHIHHSLVELLSQMSPIFKRNFIALNKKRFNRHPFERISTPIQVHSWTTPTFEHTVDHVRAEDLFSSRLVIEEHIPGQQTRDWNEEMATTRELPRTTLPERLLRERAMFKVHSDFVAAATRGAMMVVDGNVMAINPGDPKHMRMYIWNNIFFSLGFDVRDHYKDFGGNYAAFYAPCNDLSGVKSYNLLDIDGLNVLGTVVVDYRGFRVTSQSIIPGILEREQEQSVVYGSIDFGKTAQSHEKYSELLGKTVKALHVLPHTILSGDEKKPITLHSSLECKGITGNDQRHYILDLLKTFPPDRNFLPVEGEPLPEECGKLGFPKQHCHQLATLRPELIEAFIDHLYVIFMRHCATQIVAMKSKVLADRKLQTEENIENDQNCANAGDDAENLKLWQREAVRSASKLVGSYSDTEFDIRFNHDIYSPGIVHQATEEEIEKQKKLICSAAQFLAAHQLPTFIKDCYDHSLMPTDGSSLTDTMHEKGIGVRYLGKIVQLAEDHPQLQHVHRIAIMEILVRSVKHIMRPYLQSVNQLSLSTAISHFLNCFLGSFANPTPILPEDELISNKRKKKARKTRLQQNEKLNGSPWYLLTPDTLWSQMRAEAKEFYCHEIAQESICELVEKLGIQKISLLRRLCIVMGIQIVVRDYSFDTKHKPTFTEEDVVNMFPVVKHAAPRASDAYQFYTSAQTKVHQGYLKEGLELFSEALNLFNNVYGAVHSEISACYRHIARLNYMMGDHADASSNQQKAVILSERILGIDHVTTISDYVSLALYCFAQRKISSALKLLYRARYLILTVHGCDHPEVSLIDSNIGLVLHGVQDYDLSLRFLDEALKINMKYHGDKSLKVALSHHLVARAYSCKGEFRFALNHEKETYKLYKIQLGDSHDKTKESGECLRHLTQQAVTLQRTMNEIYKNGSTATIPPLQITAPSMHSVLDLMNVINGIIFIPLSQKDLDAIRLEVHRQQVANNNLVAMATKSDTQATTVNNETTKNTDDLVPDTENDMVEAALD